MLLLADNPFLAASERWGCARLERQPSPIKNRVWGFSGKRVGRLLSSRPLRRRTAIGYRGCEYKTALGRGEFLSPDPLGHAASMDLYSYCNGDPVNGLDPDGRFGKQVVNFFAQGNPAESSHLKIQQLLNPGVSYTPNAQWSRMDAVDRQYAEDIDNGTSGAEERFDLGRRGVMGAVNDSAQTQYKIATANIIDSISIAATVLPMVKGGATALMFAEEGAIAGKAAEAKIPWGFWDDYVKVSAGGREYAQVGDRLFTRHAVDRMTPSRLGTAAGARIGDGAGRSISPNFIEGVIRGGTRTDVTVDGVMRSIYRSGSVEVVTEGAGKTVITVNPFKY